MNATIFECVRGSICMVYNFRRKSEISYIVHSCSHYHAYLRQFWAEPHGLIMGKSSQMSRFI